MMQVFCMIMLIAVFDRNYMSEIRSNLFAFIIFCIVFSGFAACSAPQNDAMNTANTAKPSNTADTAATTDKSSEYPPLASGLADSEFELLDGTKFKVSDRKGKVLLLNIWGTWCQPCRAEMPHLVALQNKYGAQGFEVIGLNIGDGEGTPETIEEIKAFATSMKLNYTLARSPNAATAQFYKITKQQVVPQTLVVDRDGRLRGVFIGGGPRVVNSMTATVAKVIDGTQSVAEPQTAPN